MYLDVPLHGGCPKLVGDPLPDLPDGFTTPMFAREAGVSLHEARRLLLRLGYECHLKREDGLKIRTWWRPTEDSAESISVGPTGLKFAEVVQVLTGIFCIPEERQETFRYYLKSLYRNGVPEGVNVGRGKKARYSEGALWQMIIVCELVNCGLPIQTAIRAAEPAVRDRLWERLTAFSVNFQNLGGSGGDRLSGVRVDLEGLRKALRKELGA